MSSTRSRRASRSLRGWWMVSTTATPSRARSDRMSTTLAALVESRPGNYNRQDRRDLLSPTRSRLYAISS
eukprot:scaffold675187_cov50-Prasinocladus_malaysianus.AAC.1